MARNWLTQLTEPNTAEDNTPELEDMEARYIGTTQNAGGPTTEVREDTPATPKAEKPSKPEKPAKKKKDKPAVKNAHKEEYDDTFGKDRINIYLPQGLSTSLRMFSVLSRKPLSNIIEKSLTATLTRHYQCNAPSCMANFAILDTDMPPKCCPLCSGTDISYISPNGR